jgi:hypothetical protein
LIAKIRATDKRIEIVACVGVLRRLKTPRMRECLEKAAKTAEGREKSALKEALQLYDEWIPPEERAANLREKLKMYLEEHQLRPRQTGQSS